MPKYQNKGIGTAVLKEILFENNNRDIILQCFKENSAINLLEMMGFKKKTETQTHYIMKKNRMWGIRKIKIIYKEEMIILI